MGKVTLILLFFTISACATVKIQSTPPKAKVFAITEQNSKGEELGETPLQQSLGDILEKVNGEAVLLEIRSEGYVSKEILIPNFSLGEISISASLKKNEEVNSQSNVADSKPGKLFLSGFDENSEVYLLTKDNENKKLPTPVEVSTLDVSKNTYRITNENSLSVDMTIENKKDEVKILFGVTNEAKQSIQSIKTQNAIFRNVQLINQHLSYSQFDLVISKSDALISQYPYLAAPHILKSLAFLEKGRKGEAKESLERARNLDPEDSSIDVMINSLK